MGKIALIQRARGLAGRAWGLACVRASAVGLVCCGAGDGAGLERVVGRFPVGGLGASAAGVLAGVAGCGGAGDGAGDGAAGLAAAKGAVMLAAHSGHGPVTPAICAGTWSFMLQLGQ